MNIFILILIESDFDIKIYQELYLSFLNKVIVRDDNDFSKEENE
jgi:hypothetical protein